MRVPVELGNSSKVACTCVAVAVFSGCGGSASPTSADAAAPGDSIPGYVHTLERSRFDLGSLRSEDDNFGFHHYVGTHGTFATELASKAALAVTDSVIPYPPERAFRGNAQAQARVVLAYFVGAGLPAEQVLNVATSGVEEANLNGPGTIIAMGSFSVLKRAYDGVDIEDSSAWALLERSGESIYEQVYWPAIDAEVVSELRSFQRVLADPGSKARFFASLPAGTEPGTLVVHHTAADWTGKFVARSCYRATLGSVVLHFDATGHVVQLPDELAVEK